MVDRGAVDICSEERNEGGGWGAGSVEYFFSGKRFRILVSLPGLEQHHLVIRQILGSWKPEIKQRHDLSMRIECTASCET